MKDGVKIGLGTFIGIAMAMIATVRSVPTIASTGWQMLIYMLLAVIFFALPISLMTSELSTMLPGQGGPQLWVRTGLGRKWGFVVSWLLWAQVFPGTVMITSTLSALIANAFGMPQLGENHWFTMLCSIVIYWAIIALCIRFDMVKISGSIGVWFGVYLPVAVMIIMGLLTLVKTGINPAGLLGAFSWKKLLPQPKTLTYLAAIAFVFTGIETLGVYVPRLEHPAKNAARGILTALVGVICLNVINGLLVANVIPAKAGSAQLTDIAQPVRLYCAALGWPEWIVNVFSILAASGLVFQLAGWVTGPSQTIIQVAEEGLVPSQWGFFKHNDIGVSKQVILVQAVCVTAFALMYAFPNVNDIFLLLTDTTALMFCIVYALIATSFIRLRLTRPDSARPFRIGKRGNAAAWVWTILFFIGIVGVGLIGIVTEGWTKGILMVVIAAVLTVIPLIIDAKRNPKWHQEAQAYREDR